MMNKSSDNHPGRRPANGGGGGKKPLRSTAVVFSVVDRGGNTLLIQRMDEAFVSSCDIS
jgi:hypothetical protein